MPQMHECHECHGKFPMTHFSNSMQKNKGAHERVCMACKPPPADSVSGRRWGELQNGPPAPVEGEITEVVAVPAAAPDGTAVVAAAASNPQKRKRGGVKVPRWKTEEEDQLKAMVEASGKNWVLIAEQLGSGRTPMGCEQHWCARAFAFFSFSCDC